MWGEEEANDQSVCHKRKKINQCEEERIMHSNWWWSGLKKKKESRKWIWMNGIACMCCCEINLCSHIWQSRTVMDANVNWILRAITKRGGAQPLRKKMLWNSWARLVTNEEWGWRSLRRPRLHIIGAFFWLFKCIWLFKSRAVLPDCWVLYCTVWDLLSAHPWLWIPPVAFYYVWHRVMCLCWCVCSDLHCICNVTSGKITTLW